MRTQRTPKKFNYKLFLLGGAVLVLLAGALAYGLNRNNDSSSTQEGTTRDGVNYGPPTEQDKEDVEQNKKELSDEKDQPSDVPAPGSQASKTPIITYAGQYESAIEISGYVPGIFEDGGTCKAQLTKGSLKITKESEGFKDVNRTTCTPFAIPRSEFSEAGNWSLVLSYSSSTTVGSSEPKTIGVQ